MGGSAVIRTPVFLHLPDGWTRVGTLLSGSTDNLSHMIRHIVLLELTSSATEDDRRAIIDALATLPDQIPAILDYRFGVDAGLAEGNVDIGVTADFHNGAAYREYATHQAHLDIIAEHIKPVLASRTAVQIEI